MKTYYPGNFSGNDRRYNRNQNNYDSGLTNKGTNSYWRNGRNRQKSGPDSDAILNEGITAIKDYLKEITDLQKRLVGSQEQIAKAQETHAEAMRQIAGCLKQFLGKSTNIPFMSETDEIEDREAEPVKFQETPPREASNEFAPDASESDESESDLSLLKETFEETALSSPDSADSMVEAALKVIAEMRENKVSFEKIADHLEAEGVPPISGLGKWNRRTVSKFYKEAVL